MLLATIDKFRKYVFKKNLYLIYLLLVISFSLPAIWLQGRIIYFWDGLLPLKTVSDFSYLNFSWNQINGLGYANSIDKYNIYLLSYYFFKIFIKNIAIVQYLLISVLISFSTIGMFLLLKHLNVLLNKNVNDIFPFLGSLFYILNFYFIFTFSDFSSTIYIYSFLPVDVLTFTKAIESINNTKIFLIWTLLFGLLLEVTSYSFLLVPMLLFFLFTIGSFTFIFIKYIKTTKVTLVKYITNISLFIFSVIAINIWWIIGYFTNFMSESEFTSSTGLSTIVIDFTTNGYYPLKILSTISFYPQLFPIKYANNWFWISYYYPKYFVFPLIALVLFVVILIPLFLIRGHNSLFNKSLKFKIYIVLFMILFFALQGINPINRYIFYYLQDTYSGFLVNLYSTRLPFMRMPLLFFYTILFYDSLYEIYNFKIKRKNRVKDRVIKIHSTSINKKFRVYFIIIILILLLIVYPFYIYTPYAMQSYNTGHGNVPETVVFPKYFYTMANYINTHANNSDTLILPLSFDMLSMNFSHCNGFADDSYAGLITGSPIINGQNSTLFNLINNDINLENTNFSILLSNINVKYVLIDTIYNKNVIGYPQNTNISEIIRYINNQDSIKLVTNFGPLLLYKNICYNGIITSEKTIPSLLSLYNSSNYVSVLPSFSSIQTIIDKNMSCCKNITYKYTNSGANLTFPVETAKLTNGYYFTNNKILNINISKYRYLIVTAKSTNGNFQNGTYFAIETYTYLNNDSTATSYLKPLYSSTYFQGCNSFHTYIYQLYNNQFNDEAGYYNFDDGNGGFVHYITIAVGWHTNSRFPAYLNISNIGFSHQIDPISSLLYSTNITSDYKGKVTVPKISYIEENPTLYKVNVVNATGRFAIILRQNYNSQWTATSIAKIKTEHFVADYLENGWIVNKTGNYTFYIQYTPQTDYNDVNFIAISANIFAVTLCIAIMVSKRMVLK